MPVWTCRHQGHWVGAATVVVANTEAEARKLLEAALEAEDLGHRSIYQAELVPLDLVTPGARIVYNGDY